MTFENFCVGETNRFAYSTALTVAQKPGQIHNPLVLLGPSGTEKTHLLYAIADKARELRPELRLVRTDIRAFTDELIAAIQSKSSKAFWENYQAVDLLMIDNIEFLGGKTSTQEEIFSILNGICESKKQVVLTVSGDRVPEWLEEYLETRQGHVAFLELPDYGVRLAIVDSKAKAYGLELPRELREYIAVHTGADAGCVDGVVKSLCAYAASGDTELTCELVQQIIGIASRKNNTPDRG